MRSCSLRVVGLLVATAAALRPPAASPGRRAAIFSAGSAVTSCLLSHPAFAGGAAAPSAARTPPARAHARALPTDADADREIAALTKKIAADEASLVEDRKVILHHARSTSPAPPRSCLTRLCGPTLAAALHESAHAPARARQAKRELQLEIRQLRSFQKTEEAELKREEKIEKGLEKSGRARSPSP